MNKSTITNDPVRDHDKFMVRLPEGMRNRIKAEADKNNRSMNAEIVATLEEAYPAPQFEEGMFLEQFVRPLVLKTLEGDPGRFDKLDRANNYLNRIKSDMRLTFAKVDGEERLIFLTPTQKDKD